MAKHTIEIVIDENGIITSEVHGILGSGCDTECKWLDELGKVLEHRKTKDASKTKKVILMKKVTA